MFSSASHCFFLNRKYGADCPDLPTHHDITETLFACNINMCKSAASIALYADTNEFSRNIDKYVGTYIRR